MKQNLYYNKLREKGYSHEETKEFIPKSDRTLFRYLREYRELLGSEVESSDNMVPELDILELLAPTMVELQSTQEYIWNSDRHIHMVYPWMVDPRTIPEHKKVVGVLPDPHAPFTKWGYIKQAIKIFLQNGVNVIVQVGDLCDKHTFSRYDNHPEAIGTLTEFKMAYDFIQQLAEVFPYMYITPGNHDTRTDAQAAKAGIPKHFLKSDAQAYDYPDTWYVSEYVTINGVVYEHGTQSGKDCHIKAALNNFSSTCIGHAHTNFGVHYVNTKSDRLIMGISSGCLIDRESYAFNYSKKNIHKFILGVAVVYNNKFGIVIPIEEC